MHKKHFVNGRYYVVKARDMGRDGTIAMAIMTVMMRDKVIMIS